MPCKIKGILNVNQVGNLWGGIEFKMVHDIAEYGVLLQRSGLCNNGLI